MSSALKQRLVLLFWFCFSSLQVAIMPEKYLKVNEESKYFSREYKNDKLRQQI